MKPRLLDLFSGAGGCARGYQQAGFHVIGVDLEPQPRYAGDEFIQGDALEFAAAFDWSTVDAVHASPPCQDHSPLRSVAGEHGTGWMLDAIRTVLRATGLPYVIENVEAARMPGSLVLCGTEFGLTAGDRWLRRHRRFESNVFLLGAGGCQCSRRTSPTGVYGDLSLNDRPVRHSKRGDVMLRAGVETARTLLGCPWMNAAELSQAIPPAYTRHVGEYLLAAIREEVLA